jgi:hypothetical protein
VFPLLETKRIIHNARRVCQAKYPQFFCISNSFLREEKRRGLVVQTSPRNKKQHMLLKCSTSIFIFCPADALLAPARLGIHPGS